MDYNMSDEVLMLGIQT